jgi:hypothetical protein
MKHIPPFINVIDESSVNGKSFCRPRHVTLTVATLSSHPESDCGACPMCHPWRGSFFHRDRHTDAYERARPMNSIVDHPWRILQATFKCSHVGCRGTTNQEVYHDPTSIWNALRGPSTSTNVRSLRHGASIPKACFKILCTHGPGTLSSRSVFTSRVAWSILKRESVSHSPSRAARCPCRPAT